MNLKIFLILLALVQMLIDPTMAKCQSFPGKTLLMFHHFANIYILLGGYVSNPRIHLMVVLVSFTVHYFNKRLCPITVVNNKMCGFPKKQQMQTILNVIEPNPTRVVYLYYFFLMLGVLYDLHWIIKTN